MTHYTEDHLLMLEKGDMTIEEFDSLLCDYADNELPRTIKAMMDAKADKCPICAELKRTYLLTVKVAGSFRGEFSLSEDVENRIRQKLSERLGLNLAPIRMDLN
jgi:hypothetical protein